MAEMENRRRTRNYFPEPRFQLSFLRFLLLGALLHISASCAILYYFLKQNYELLVKYAGLEPEITTLLFRELRILIAVIGVTFAVYLLGTLILGIAFSHRIAGPLFAVKRTIRDLNAGKDVRLKLRKGDEWQDLVDEFNAMVEKLKRGAA